MQILVALSRQADTNTFPDVERRLAVLPRVLYHGTASLPFKQFSSTIRNVTDSGWLGAGFYMTSSFFQAKGYADRAYQKKRTGKARVLSAVPRQGLRVYQMSDREYRVCHSWARKPGKESEEFSAKIASALKAAGYDGAAYLHPTDERVLEVVLFDPKSVTITEQDVKQ